MLVAGQDAELKEEEEYGLQDVDDMPKVVIEHKTVVCFATRL